jgi:glycosyltransferase involved in cell wall biosynthesis
VQVTGVVDDLRPYLQSATLAVAPIRYGTGIQNKVLEAMACATPVVASHQAVSALQVAPGEDLIVADQPREFARAILELLNDPERRLRWPCRSVVCRKTSRLAKGCCGFGGYLPRGQRNLSQRWYSPTRNRSPVVRYLWCSI